MSHSPLCLTCQLQKIPCDGRRPRCARCTMSDFSCAWPDPSPPEYDDSAPSTAARVASACLACRRRKVKCGGPTGTEPDSICPRCERLSLVCTWTENKPGRSVNRSQRSSISAGAARPVSAMSRPSLPTVNSARMSVSDSGSLSVLSPSRALMNDKVEIQQVLRTYFGTVHYFGYLSYIHEPTIFRLLDTDSHPKDLTAVMIACTLRLTGDRSQEVLNRADELFQNVLHRIQRQMYEAYGAVELMTVVLMRQYQQMRGQYSSAWMLWGNAVKMMQYLSLHLYDEVYSQPQTMRINKLLKPEALRRLAWAVLFLDTMADAGRHGVHTVSEETYHIQLPCDETAFARGIEMRTRCLSLPNEMSILSPTGQTARDGSSGLGISAHVIQTALYRRKICHYKSRIKYLTDSADEMLNTLTGMEVGLRALMAEIPPDLVYSTDNLYINPERRTAFILLHALRHNCFIMLAEARLIISSKEPSFHDKGYQWMRDRIKHAYPVASIVSDALRLGIVCDPWVGALAYTAIEVLLFDTPRLAQIDPTINDKSPELFSAVRKLLDMIRHLVNVDDGMKHMRIEACRRIIKRGLKDEILTLEDLQVCQSDQHASGQDDDEFDWRLFRWHRLEQTTKIPNVAKNPWAAEAILDIDAMPMSRGPSRRPSPRPDQLDASAVSLSTLPIESETVPEADQGELDWPPSELHGVRGADLLSFSEGQWSFEDNFMRFMNQAGYTSVNDGSEAFPWLA